MSDRKIIPVHEWTHVGDEVLILKCVPADGVVTGRGDSGDPYRFAWPLVVGAEVEAPDWNDRAECGGGLHGWPWGFAFGDGKNPDWEGRWIVFGAKSAEVVNLKGKVKARRGVIRFIGTWSEANSFILAGQMAWVAQAAESATTGYRAPAATTGDSAPAATTGYRAPAATTGDRAPAATTGYSAPAATTGYSAPAATTGDRAPAATTGDSAPAATTGDRAPAATTGDRAPAATTGDSAPAATTGYSAPASATGKVSLAACLGFYGRAKAGPYGCIVLCWWNLSAGRAELRCAQVGCGDGSDGKLKSDSWYVLDGSGEIVAEVL